MLILEPCKYSVEKLTHLCTNQEAVDQRKVFHFLVRDAILLDVCFMFRCLDVWMFGCLDISIFDYCLLKDFRTLPINHHLNKLQSTDAARNSKSLIVISRSSSMF